MFYWCFTHVSLIQNQHKHIQQNKDTQNYHRDSKSWQRDSKPLQRDSKCHKDAQNCHKDAQNHYKETQTATKIFKLLVVVEYLCEYPSGWWISLWGLRVSLAWFWVSLCWFWVSFVLMFLTFLQCFTGVSLMFLCSLMFLLCLTEKCSSRLRRIIEIRLKITSHYTEWRQFAVGSSLCLEIVKNVTIKKMADVILNVWF